MIKYYTRACNFYYGKLSKKLVKNKQTLSLFGNKEISFDELEIFTKNGKKVSSKIINIKKISSLPKIIKIKVISDLKKISLKRKFINNKDPILMGVLNVTPDSFSDGGKFNNKKKGLKKIIDMIDSGADIIDIGGESTRPGSKIISPKIEWERVKAVIKNFKKKFPKILLSIDTRKSFVMRNSIKHNVDIINDVSCFKFDTESYSVIKKKKFMESHSSYARNTSNNAN